MTDDPGPIDHNVGPSIIFPRGIVDPIQGPYLPLTIAQEGKTDLEGPGEIAVHLGWVHADPQDLSVSLDETGRLLPEPGELFRSPRGEGTNVKGQDHVPLPQKVTEMHYPTGVIRQRKIRSPVPHLQRLGRAGDADAYQESGET